MFQSKSIEKEEKFNIFIGRTRFSLLLLSLTSTSAPIAKLTTDITRRDISRFSGVMAVNFVINVLKIYNQPKRSVSNIFNAHLPLKINRNRNKIV